ncbi:hypothetical protein FHP05_02220 [Cerasibacillus terrae]|uniref:Heptaprenyl diphosphate synthase n=1 Tax=Cerasibacillus terrae TaxID=2498845 RepID=A0A5C8P310_9BACI|nr:heptaprenyl diphosphate synthase component 1 [Cerasibacillus terrae]TXL67858.1 hypothetical protein FHP05_02220 [Cerasibacillus terrae]
MHNISSELEKIKTDIEDEVHYKYLEKYIQKPKIEQEKLFLIYSILLNHNISFSKKNNYIITTMLVQLALDTHDLVNNDETVDQSGVTIEQQLNVLAGDYYSSLYYLFLSKIEEQRLIHTLAVAIREINEAKIKLYYHEFKSFEELLDIVKKIESTLYTHIALFIDESTLVPFIEEWLLLITLSKLKYKKEPTIFDKMYISSNDTDFMNFIDTQMEQQMRQLREITSQLPERYISLKNHSEIFLNKLVK